MKGPPRLTSLDELHPAFRHDVDLLLSAIEDERLPFVVFETRRTVARQNYLHSIGASKAKGLSGAHPHGLAVDFVLDEKNPRWAENHERPIGSPTAGSGRSSVTGATGCRATWPSSPTTVVVGAAVVVVVAVCSASV